MIKEGYIYILKCCDESYYTGSTTDLKLRIKQHRNREGFNYTSKRLPVKLVYFEKHKRIDKKMFKVLVIDNNEDLVDLKEVTNIKCLSWDSKREDFVNYPLEYWHFSYGNAEWASYGNKDKAFYGAINF